MTSPAPLPGHSLAPPLLLGAHMSIAGGVTNALLAGKRTGCDTLQLFTKSSNQWRARPLDREEVARFRATQKETGIAPLVVHDSYLINVATPNPDLRERSIAALTDELDRAELLGIPYLVMHPGAHVGRGVESGLARVADALNHLHRDRPAHQAMILLEITAGQGTTLGRTFEELREILDQLDEPERVGICLDTCHLFAAGYDFSTPRGFALTMTHFDRVLGFGKLHAVHLNDSKKGLNCHVDRHEQIGKGHLGLEPFRLLLNDPRFRGIPLILETPKGEHPPKDGPDTEDLENLRVLRTLVCDGSNASHIGRTT